MAEPVKVAVVGPGIIWHRVHKPILKKLSKHYTPVAFCSRTEEKAQKAAADFPGSKVCSDYNAMMEERGIDAVVVTTPIMLNAPVAIAALEAGKDVYLEKPMAASLADADKIIELEKSHRKKVYVLEQVPYSDSWEPLLEILHSGKLGRAMMYDKLSHSLFERGADRMGYSDTAWRINAEYPLGILFDGGIHAIALLALFFGAPKSVFAAGQSLRKEYGDYDTVNMLFGYESGLEGFFSFSSLLPGKRNYFHIRFTGGTVSLDDRKLTVSPLSGKSRTYDPKETSAKNPHFDMWKKITQRRLEGKPPFYTSVMARRDVACLLAVEESLKTGKKVLI